VARLTPEVLRQLVDEHEEVLLLFFFITLKPRVE